MRPSLATFIGLCFSSLLSVLFVFLRFYYSESAFYTFLVWNLFLAWIPYILSLLLYIRYRQTKRLTLLMLATCSIWLLFYPNSLYLLTDLIHLQKKTGVPIWFDSFMFLSFVWNGLILGYFSLYKMQYIVRARRGNFISWVFVTGSLTLSSLGVYLGRYLRWNSWDIFTSPVALAKDTLRPLIHPIAYSGPLKITLLYAVFFILSYLLFYKFTHFDSDNHE